ncbi:hypothetical protein AOQ84DRAFT_24219 [Glonium stellatum]|uniref:Uncharacterized protein n=1 Tax=Glonium stellatum TaxID=574774 RepID=A0A8E2JTW0_9PEZI|nr:hypothetical protein AOQ84DRAFT_24219 [Glonium stellatum]
MDGLDNKRYKYRSMPPPHGHKSILIWKQQWSKGRTRYIYIYKRDRKRVHSFSFSAVALSRALAFPYIFWHINSLADSSSSTPLDRRYFPS